MTDLFVKVWADNPIRLGMAMSVVARCQLFKDVKLHVLVAEDTLHVAGWPITWLPKEEFWISSKAYAEQKAKSDVYVVLDDDHLPIGADWVQAGKKAMEHHPDFACLSSWSINGEVPSKVGDEWVWEDTCTGTPYFIRKGILNPAKMPVGTLPSYDTTLSEHIRSQGHKIGFLRQVRHNHLGYGFSQVIPGWWKA